MTAPALRFLLTADNKASATFAKIRGELTSIGTSAKSVLGSIGPGLATALSVAGLVGFTKAATDGIDRLNDLKDATGASIENLSALEDVAVRTGSGIETASDAVLKLNKALNTAADPKSDAAAAIKALGLSVTELQALDPVVALQKVGQALNGFADNGAKGRLQMVLLGKSTKELAQFLKELGDAGPLVAKVTTEQAEAAEAYNKQLFNLQKNATDAARALAINLLPALNDVLGAFNKDGFKAALDAFGERIGFGKAYYGARNVKLLTAEVVSLQHQLNSPTIGDKSDIAGKLAVKQKQLDDLTRATRVAVAADKALADIKNPANYGNEGRRQGTRPSLPAVIGGGTAADKKPKKVESIGATGASEAMQDALKAIEGTDVVKVQKLTAALDELFNLRAGGLGGDAATDEAIARLRDELEKLDPVAQRAAESKRALDALLATTASGQDKQRLDTVLLINKAFDDGKISLGQWGELTDQIDDNLGKTKDTAKDVADDIGQVLGNAAGSAFTKFNDLRGLLKGVRDDIAQIALRETVSKPATKALTGWLGGLLGSADGNAFGRSGVMPFASGGIVDSPTLFAFANGTGLMGEAGPEAIMPLKRGRNGQLGVQGAGAVALTVVNHIDSRTDAAVVGQLVAQGVAAGQQQMLQQLKSAGVV
jgi:acylphosphatase